MSNTDLLLIFFYDLIPLAVACTSRECGWAGGAKKKEPGAMKEKVYPSLLYDTLRRATFFPTPTYFRRRLQNPQQVMNDFLCDLSASPQQSFWFKCIKIKYGDFDVTEEYVNQVFRAQFNTFMQSLHDLIEDGHTGPYYEFTETRGQAASDLWKALRRLFITASIARRVMHLTDEGKKNFLRSHLWDFGQH